MSAESQSFIENPFVKGGLSFFGVLIAAGISIGFIKEVLALAK
jgi:hypothetical protein